MRAIWDISKKCNLHCEYCGADFLNIEEKKSFNGYEVEKIITNIAGIVDEIELYGGEPLILDNIGEILERLSENNINIDITTNGQSAYNFFEIISQKNIRLRNLSVSIDGSKEENDILRGKGSHQKAFSFLKRAIELKQCASLNYNVGISAVITMINKDDVIENIKNWLNAGVDYILITPVVEIGRARGKSKLLLNAYETLNLYENVIGYTSAMGLQDKVYLDISNPYLAEYLNAKYKTQYSIDSPHCSAVEEVIYIDLDGKLKSCRNNQEYVINLCQDNIREGLKNFSSFLKRKKEFSGVMECNCIYNRVCNKCCLSKNNTKEKICIEIDKRYRLEDFRNKRKFLLRKDTCLYNNLAKDYFNIFYAHLQETVSYESEGFFILKTIEKNSMTAPEIAEKTGINQDLVFRFLIQEYSKKHVEMLEVKYIC